jgi:hypothetical protein
MRDLSLPGPDGPANILAAIRVAASNRARGKRRSPGKRYSSKSAATGPTSTDPRPMGLTYWPAQTTVINLIADSAHRGVLVQMAK